MSYQCAFCGFVLYDSFAICPECRGINTQNKFIYTIDYLEVTTDEYTSIDDNNNSDNNVDK